MLYSELIKFVSLEFPESAQDIKEELLVLSELLERTIDLIEDKSTTLIKKDRNFAKSMNYRQNSMELFGMSKKIENYLGLLEDSMLDKTVPYRLTEDYTKKVLYAFQFNGKKVEVKNWEDLYLKVQKEIGDYFADNLQVENQDKDYDYEVEEVEVPSMVQPKNVKRVEEKSKDISSENEIRDLILALLKRFKIDPNEFKIYLKADFSRF